MAARDYSNSTNSEPDDAYEAYLEFEDDDPLEEDEDRRCDHCGARDESTCICDPYDWSD